MLNEIKRKTIVSFDGTQIEVQSYGQGDLTMVIANGIGGTMAVWAPLLKAFKQRVRFISWDYRGLYHSSAPASLDALRVEDHAQDLQCIMAGLQLSDVVLCGWSMGVQVGLQAYHNMPERFKGLILINGSYGEIFDNAFNNPLSRHIIPRLNMLALKLAPALPTLISKTGNAPFFVPLLELLGIVDRKLDKEVFMHIVNLLPTLDFENYCSILKHLNNHSAKTFLREIDVPLLFINGTRDGFTPPSTANVFLEHAPQTEVFIIPNGTHYALLEYPEMMNKRIAAFLEKHFGELSTKSA
ncbi:MAG: alpha/beta hydrolase [Myxococcota bacterium]|jgi:pimeloyl-ACP methyl ester carboxylesterase|nr:alpha/beta hydrolase [Myxococcota bacterium]